MAEGSLQQCSGLMDVQVLGFIETFTAWGNLTLSEKAKVGWWWWKWSRESWGVLEGFS